jgi:hypothetical protein
LANDLRRIDALRVIFISEEGDVDRRRQRDLGPARLDLGDVLAGDLERIEAAGRGDAKPGLEVETIHRPSELFRNLVAQPFGKPSNAAASLGRAGAAGVRRLRRIRPFQS